MDLPIIEKGARAGLPTVSAPSKIPNLVATLLVVAVAVTVVACFVTSYFSTSSSRAEFKGENIKIKKWQADPTREGVCVQVEGVAITGFDTERECMFYEFGPKRYDMQIGTDGWPTGKCVEVAPGQEGTFADKEECEQSFDPATTTLAVQCIPNRGCVPTRGDCAGKTYLATKNDVTRGGCADVCKSRFRCNPNTKQCESAITSNTDAFPFETLSACTTNCKPDTPSQKYFWNPNDSTCWPRDSPFPGPKGTCDAALVGYDTFDNCMHEACRAGCHGRNTFYCASAKRCSRNQNKCCGPNVCRACEDCVDGRCVSRCGLALGDAGCTKCDVDADRCEMQPQRLITSNVCETQCICTIRRPVTKEDGTAEMKTENVHTTTMYDLPRNGVPRRKPEYEHAQIISCRSSLPSKRLLCSEIAEGLCEQWKAQSTDKKDERETRICQSYEIDKRFVATRELARQGVENSKRVLVDHLNSKRDASLPPLTIDTFDIDTFCRPSNIDQDFKREFGPHADPTKMCNADGTYTYNASHFDLHSIYGYNSRGNMWPETMVCATSKPESFGNCKKINAENQPWCAVCHDSDTK